MSNECRIEVPLSDAYISAGPPTIQHVCSASYLPPPTLPLSSSYRMWRKIVNCTPSKKIYIPFLLSLLFFFPKKNNTQYILSVFRIFYLNKSIGGKNINEKSFLIYVTRADFRIFSREQKDIPKLSTK